MNLKPIGEQPLYIVAAVSRVSASSMGIVDDDRTFKLDLSGDSLVKLRHAVAEVLKEFMGDYTDDTLVEYVIVLLKNGRRKDEAKNELNVFLGDDDSHSFVSWLWDHLASNKDLHIQPEDSHMEDAIKRKSVSGDEAGKSDSLRLSSTSEKVRSERSSRSRHNREWGGLVREADELPPVLSSETGDVRVGTKVRSKVTRAESPSLRHGAQRKRDRHDERQDSKREMASQVNIDAPRRLLQFAFRDALTTTGKSNLTTEPTLKRLRSVVSTSTGDSSLVDSPRRLQSATRVPNSMATVMKAVAAAAEDVTRVKSSSVFDRLGRAMDVSETSEPLTLFREVATEDVDCEGFHEHTRSAYLQRSQYSGLYAGNSMLDSETGLPSDFVSDNEGLYDGNVLGHRVADVSETGTSVGNNAGSSLKVQYSIAKKGDDLRQISANKDQGQLTTPAKNSHKIVNISVNVNTCKPPHYKEPRGVAEWDDWKPGQGIDVGTPNSDLCLMKKNNNHVPVSNDNANLVADSHKVLSSSGRAGPYAAGRLLEDADSRTIFVSNVHFAATKDSICRHFNKFGEVLKVVILTDTASGQPRGSAYVEFMQKGAADNALSLDGTSFMSRILKVIKRSAAHQDEAAPAMTWQRGTLGSPFPTARFSRASFPRGMPSEFRPRASTKPGARSMQWKRDSQTTPGEIGTPVSDMALPSLTGRSLTYVRTEAKPVGN